MDIQMEASGEVRVEAKWQQGENEKEAKVEAKWNIT